MPLSKNEHRTLYDSIYVDMLDLTGKVKKLFQDGATNQEVINALNNATNNIPAKAVRLINKTK